MKVDKLIKAEMNREYFFVKGNIPIDTKYFIEKINQGVNESNNNSYKTNVIGPMTHYEYFVKDDKFFEILLPLNINPAEDEIPPVPVMFKEVSPVIEPVTAVFVLI